MEAPKLKFMYPVNDDAGLSVVNDAPILGGYYIKARKIDQSEIAHAAPHVREIWDWLIKEANHKPYKANGKTIDRGQLVTDFKHIQEGLHWWDGFVKKSYKKHQVDNALRWLRQHSMVTTQKTTRGMIVTVCKYAYYQNPKNYENDNGYDTVTTPLRQGTDRINKNDKNKKNGSSEFVPPAVEEVIAYFLEKGYTEASARKAHENYHVADWVDSKGKPVKNWKQKMNNVWFKEENKIQPEVTSKEVDMDEYLDRPRIIPIEEL